MTNDRPLAAITGASSGIGATFARRLAGDGYRVLLAGRRAARLEEMAAELRGEAFPADLTRDEDVTRLAGRLASAANLELLVNNAGFGSKGFFFEADAAGQEAMHRLHVLATERLTRAALPGMVARAKGGIINVSSVAAFMQSPTNVSYSATKAWMNSFTEGLWLELRSIGSPVAVQALCPGYTYSEFHDVMQADRGDVPKAWWMSAETVVEESLRGLRKGRLIVVPSARYRTVVLLLKLLPRSLLRLGAARYRKPRRL
jgi:short-subunit dehydrogenase